VTQHWYAEFARAISDTLATAALAKFQNNHAGLQMAVPAAALPTRRFNAMLFTGTGKDTRRIYPADCSRVSVVYGLAAIVNKQRGGVARTVNWQIDVKSTAVETELEKAGALESPAVMLDLFSASHRLAIREGQEHEDSVAQHAVYVSQLKLLFSVFNPRMVGKSEAVRKRVLLAFLYGIEDLETARFEQCLPWDHEDGQINRILWQATLTAMWAALTAPAAAAFAVDKLSQAQMNQIRNMLVSAKVLDPALRNGLWQLDTQLFHLKRGAGNNQRGGGNNQRDGSRGDGGQRDANPRDAQRPRQD
jgi:hypothetical protein